MPKYIIDSNDDLTKFTIVKDNDPLVLEGDMIPFIELDKINDLIDYNQDKHNNIKTTVILHHIHDAIKDMISSGNISRAEARILINNLNLFNTQTNKGFYGKFTKLQKEYITKNTKELTHSHTWVKTKANKNDPETIAPVGKYTHIFQDTGITPQKLLGEIEVVATAATAWDPASSIKHDFIWPAVGTTISLTDNFLTMIGYENVELIEIERLGGTSDNLNPLNLNNDEDWEKIKEIFNINIVIKLPSGTKETYDSWEKIKDLIGGNTKKNKKLKNRVNKDKKAELIYFKGFGDTFQGIFYILASQIEGWDEWCTFQTLDFPLFALITAFRNYPVIFKGPKDKGCFSILEYLPLAPNKMQEIKYNKATQNIIYHKIF